MGLINFYRKAKLYKLLHKVVDHPELLKDSKWWYQVFKTCIDVKEIREMLKGYKTYIIAALTAAVTLLHTLNYIDEAMFQNLLALLASGGAAAVAAKINRIGSELK